MVPVTTSPDPHIPPPLYSGRSLKHLQRRRYCTSVIGSSQTPPGIRPTQCSKSHSILLLVLGDYADSIYVIYEYVIIPNSKKNGYNPQIKKNIIIPILYIICWVSSPYLLGSLFHPRTPQSVPEPKDLIPSLVAGGIDPELQDASQPDRSHG